MQFMACGFVTKQAFGRGYLLINYTCFDFVSQFRGLKSCAKKPKVFWDFAEKDNITDHET